jgi:Astacin (Peptidase family M12A)
MQRNPQLRICYDRIVPAELSVASSVLHKMREDALLKATGAATPREAFHDLDTGGVIPAPHMAIISAKSWPVGSAVKCRFLEGSPTQQAKVMHKAKLWEQYANIHVDFVTTPDEQVRISFQADSGSWSAVGVDALNNKYFPADSQTMNFGWLTDDTDDTEYERVVVHEFGHALGCIHEHQSPTEQLKWNIDAVYAQFGGPPNNWDKATIDSNILQKYSADGINATMFDRHSIMLYQFPADLFTDHVATPMNTRLSKKDKSFIAQVYPRNR